MSQELLKKLLNAIEGKYENSMDLKNYQFNKGVSAARIAVYEFFASEDIDIETVWTDSDIDEVIVGNIPYE